MANLIPACPKCGESKAILAPIPQSVEIAKIKCGNLPVFCTSCSWRGVWADVVYHSV